MQHTVVALFDTYAQAEAARDALVAAGFARDDISLQARCEPTYAGDATSAAESGPPADEGFLGDIERFFESLFVSDPRPHEVAQYAEAVRRGAVMVAADAATDEAAALARSTLEGLHAIDIEERAATWHAPSDDALREHSPLEELGLRRGAARARGGSVRSYRRDRRDEAPPNATPDELSEAAATAMAAGCAPGMGAVFSARRDESRGAASGVSRGEESPPKPSANANADADTRAKRGKP